MNQIQTTAIILSRTDFGEADRILTLLTPDHGKLRLMAKGVRKIKSKLAGGIELFSVSEIAYIKGRGEIGTLVSTRLLKHYGDIVKDVHRTMFGYELIKMLNRATEDEPEEEYFDLLQNSFEALNDSTIRLELVRSWFLMQLLTLSGHTPNLMTEHNGTKLTAESRYNFNFDDMSFQAHDDGTFTSDHIKILRVGFSRNSPKVMQRIGNIDTLLEKTSPMVQTIAQYYLRL